MPTKLAASLECETSRHQPAVVGAGELGGVGRVDEQVAEQLAAHVPGERRERLRARAARRSSSTRLRPSAIRSYSAGSCSAVEVGVLGEAAQAGDHDRVRSAPGR